MQIIGITQIEMARRLHVSPVTVEKWMNGKNAISPARSREIRSVFGADIAPGSIQKTIAPLDVMGEKYSADFYNEFMQGGGTKYNSGDAKRDSDELACSIRLLLEAALLRKKYSQVRSSIADALLKIATHEHKLKSALAQLLANVPAPLWSYTGRVDALRAAFGINVEPRLKSGDARVKKISDWLRVMNWSYGSRGRHMEIDWRHPLSKDIRKRGPLAHERVTIYPKSDKGSGWAPLNGGACYSVKVLDAQA